jgi:N-acetylglucosamine-6-phosphate deacetylase
MQTVEGRAFIDGELRPGRIAWEGSQISEVQLLPSTASESIIVPGFVDLHVHGGGGHDFMDATPEAVAAIARTHARHGTAALAATTLSGSADAIDRAILAISQHRHESGSAEIAGIHLEGPYINAQKAGAQDRSSIRAPQIDEMTRWIERAGALPMTMTIAPETEGAEAFIERFRDRVIFSIGHTEVSFADAVQAIERGARRFTHLFNAMPPLQHRAPGPIAAAILSKDTTVELIADGIHLHPAILRIACELFRNRVTLVTDAMRACGMPDGAYKLYSYDVTVTDGEARLADGTLAGSVLTMAGAVKNMIELAGVALETVLPMATEVPARVIGIHDRKGCIRVGFDADLVVLSSRIEIEKVILRGTEVRSS